MAVPPPGRAGYRRYWNAYNRPNAGCGCLYTVIMFLLIWFLLSLFIDALVVWSVVLW